ncbi:PPOX class F420-dependent oxidoreductase [Streptomyces sp. NPDC090306]|uniref:PPOX class F420-dependent oxidoreductase n=1 Tax=Streptomyces sp. NPDC090306 TaxID=3365961 RepID=UPI0037F1B851
MSTHPELQPFVKQYTARLTTYKRDGTGVPTPVNVAVEGDHAYFRTPGTTWKVKRLRNNPEVDLEPSTFRGVATGPAVHARARLLDPGSDEDRRAARLLRRKHPVVQGLLVPLSHKVMRARTLHYEISPQPGTLVAPPTEPPGEPEPLAPPTTRPAATAEAPAPDPEPAPPKGDLGQEPERPKE